MNEDSSQPAESGQEQRPEKDSTTQSDSAVPIESQIPEMSPPDSTASFPPKSLPLQGQSQPSTTNSMTSGPNSGNAGQRPGPPPPRASGLTSDMAAKMKAFSLSRQGTPSQTMRSPQGLPQSGSAVTGIPSGGFTPSGQQRSGTMSPTGPLAGGVGRMNLPPAMGRPQPSSWTSAPQVGAPGGGMSAPRLAMGGLAAKRGIKGGGMKLSDATGSPQSPTAPGSLNIKQPAPNQGSAFNQFANIVDTKKGTLNFKNKAVIHGRGIEFTSGTSFSISLDEVDTLSELGKGNYGTVYKVRHARPQIRKQGQGLRGNMNTRQLSTTSVSSAASDDSTSSAPSASGTGIVMAMKEIRLELDDAKFAAIIMELDILHRCISPFIVSFYGAFFQEGSVYICLEFMDGGSVDKLYGDGIPEGVLKKITISTVMGLKFLKDEHNIIHRDVKPTNILINSRGQVKICDFGVSGNLVASIARTNIGCQSYMAPERISGGNVLQGANPGGGTYSVQSDVWSLGLTIIECAMGRYPYPPETYNNIFSQLSAIVDGDPPDLPKEGYSDAARSFVLSCLHKVPKMRPTYAMLLRHAWLSPLMKPPTISEDEEGEAAAEAGAETSEEEISGSAETADKEVASWVRASMERKLSGLMGKSEKPALHAAPLNAVTASPILERAGDKGANPEDMINQKDGVEADQRPGSEEAITDGSRADDGSVDGSNRQADVDGSQEGIPGS